MFNHWHWFFVFWSLPIVDFSKCKEESFSCVNSLVAWDRRALTVCLTQARTGWHVLLACADRSWHVRTCPDMCGHVRTDPRMCGQVSSCQEVVPTCSRLEHVSPSIGRFLYRQVACYQTTLDALPGSSLLGTARYSNENGRKSHLIKSQLWIGGRLGFGIGDIWQI